MGRIVEDFDRCRRRVQGHKAGAKAVWNDHSSVMRASADALESVVADDMWPLPTYQEMLFIR